MHFNITDYIKALSSSLSQLSRLRRIAFCLWCTETACRLVTNRLGGKFGEPAQQKLQATLDELWNWIAAGGRAAHPRLDRIAAELEDIAQRESDSGQDDPAFFASELAQGLRLCDDVCEHGRPKDAAMSAVLVINCLDYELGGTYIQNYSAEGYTDERFENELERQKKMLEHLSSTTEISAGCRTLF
jgi:hypothetical protein